MMNNQTTNQDDSSLENNPRLESSYLTFTGVIDDDDYGKCITEVFVLKLPTLGFLFLFLLIFLLLLALCGVVVNKVEGLLLGHAVHVRDLGEGGGGGGRGGGVGGGVSGGGGG